MVSQRQKIARKKYKQEHPELFPKAEPTPPKDPNKKTKRRYNRDQIKTKKTTKNKLTKHPLRVPGMKPGESCFICKAKDHIAKVCPQKAEWEKNKICLLCRRRGHSLKNCPNKNEDTNDKKFCYNCGEAGHSLSHCSQPLQEGGTKFASCFICNERGHLSKNCPKNTHGIYPKGGSCKICGGVTHLARDCPNKVNKISSSAYGGRNTQMGGAYGQKATRTKFTSGDDLEDDFTPEEADVVQDTPSLSKPESVSLLGEDEKNSPVKAKKKQGPKIVNFLG